MSKSSHNALLYIFLILLLVMFILPFYSAPGYDLFRHTTSQLGAQNTPNSWVMNITFMGLGSACIYEALNRLKKYRLQQSLLILFGVGLIFSGIYKHAPIDPAVSFSVREDDLHSWASSLVGMSFTAYAFVSIFILKVRRDKILAMTVGVLATLLSFLIFSIPDYAGLFQRVMFILAFTWLLYFFARIEYLSEIRLEQKKI